MKRQQIKDKQIKIFQELHQEDGIIKRYIHPEGTTLHAYVRQLSATEQNAFNAIQDGSALEFTINPRDIRPDMFVEFKGKVYQMGPADRFEFYKRDIKFIAYEVTQRDDYLAIEWEEWT